METLETLETRGGNTKTPLARFVPSKYWCFTAFEGEMETLETQILKNKEIKYIFGQEICPNTGKKHLQGYIELEIKIRPTEYFKTKKVHWEKRKGTRDQNLQYCRKEGNYKTNFEMPEEIEDPMTGKTWYGWQNELKEILINKPDSRDIHWMWEPTGNVGKTTFCKHLCLKLGAIYVSGKANDIKCAIMDYQEKSKKWPKIILWDVPRTAENYISYAGIEEVKNGIFFSGKYESGMAIFNPPHVVIMANFEPEINKLSLDRWQIKNLSINKCLTSTDEYMFLEQPTQDVLLTNQHMVDSEPDDK